MPSSPSAATRDRSRRCRQDVRLAAARAALLKKKATGVKAARFLASRGFDEDVIRALVPLHEDGGDDP